jgi:predicted membrane-bound dolichyl-phosphate-mannose-protein mannosyltransferase
MGEIMTKEKPRHEKRLKRSAISGIAIGVLAILACELPIILWPHRPWCVEWCSEYLKASTNG